MSTSVPPAVDLADLLARLGGNRSIVSKLVAVLEQNGPQWLLDLRAALQSGDAEQFRKTAHSAKGALATLSAMPAADHARSLEELGKAGDLANAPAAVAAFAAELDRVREAFRTIVAEFSKTEMPGIG